MRTRLLTLSIAAVLAVGCSNAPSTRAISGHLDVSQFQLSGARVVALSSSGRAFHAPISPTTGAFRIVLPVGSTYTFRFSNTTTAPKLFDAFAVYAPMKAGGVRTHWFHLTAGAPIDLGRIGKVGTVGPISTLREDGSGEAETDDGEEDDDAEACDLSNGSDTADVDAEHDILDDNDSDDDGVADSSDTNDDRDACTSASDDGDDCRLTDDEEHENDSEHDGACMPGTSRPAPVPGLR